MIREQLVRDGEPVDSGIVAFRGLSPWDGVGGAGLRRRIRNALVARAPQGLRQRQLDRVING